MESMAPNAAKAQALELLKQGQLDSAIGLLEGVRATSPDDPQLQSILGAAYAKKGDKLASIAAFEEAVRLHDTPKACYNLALAYEGARRMNEAVRQYEAAVRLDPSYQPALDSIARLRKQFQEEQARTQAAQAPAPPPSVPDTTVYATPPAAPYQPPPPQVNAPTPMDLAERRAREAQGVADLHKQLTKKGLVYGAICGSVFILLLTFFSRLFLGGFVGAIPFNATGFLLYILGILLVGAVYGAAVGWWVGYSESDGAGWRAGAVIGAFYGVIAGIMAGGGLFVLLLHLGIYTILSGIAGSIIGRLVESSIGWN